jgi:hypothetical protein
MTPLPDTPRTYNALTKTFICLFVLTTATSIVFGIILFPYFIYPNLKQAHIRQMARACPSLSTPTLNFFPIPYDFQSHSVLPFTVNQLDKCLGLCSSFGGLKARFEYAGIAK